MCGIAGLMTYDGMPPPPAPLRAMGIALRHRGPDGDGRYGSGDVGMVQTRLAIIDLATGDQPLYEPGGAALIANGEIYNYVELRAEIGCRHPVVFSTQSDCELPLHLYRHHGLDFTAHLRGMYAIALHDPVPGHLVLTRDPFGIKPLYYAETPRAFAFASEPRALIEAGIVTPKLVRSVRNELVQMQFTTGRETIFAGINRVLPGETVVVRQGRIVERHRRDALPAGGPSLLSEEEALARLDGTFMDSVRIHQRSDVPFGMFLSGGIDSIAVLAMMARLAQRPVKAFTIGFAAGDLADERPAARAAAAAVGAEHVETVFDETDFWKLLPEIVSVADDPAADYAMLPTWALARAVREAGLKVILSGEGGDELFGGYGRYRSVMRPWWAGGRTPRARGMLDGLGILRGEIAGWRDGIAAAEIRNSGNQRTPLQIAQAVDCADWLPNDLLTKIDRCLMAHSTEGRTPYLDTELAAFAFRLPDELKVKRGLGKWLLRRWLANHLPDTQPFARKRGFTVPVARWIAGRAGEIGPLIAHSAAIREICYPDAVERLFAAAASRRANRAIWNLLFYALWHRHHIERIALPSDTIAALAESG
jgi:asparagine synthase (glutamine-hydrolysing)